MDPIARAPVEGLVLAVGLGCEEDASIGQALARYTERQARGGLGEICNEAVRGEPQTVGELIRIAHNDLEGSRRYSRLQRFLVANPTRQRIKNANVDLMANTAGK